jgi:hypothetical protein
MAQLAFVILGVLWWFSVLGLLRELFDFCRQYEV